MRDLHAPQRARDGARGGDSDHGAAPGRSTLTAALAPQDGDGMAVQAAAAVGTSGPAGSLPYLDLIQRSFGNHDVSRVQAHTDANAAAGAGAMGAEAFATGDHVAFAGAPSLHTAAHEAAHVVQQRGGVQLKGGLGASGDEHERHADAVADAVVAGKSSQGLLDQYAGGQSAGGQSAGGGGGAGTASSPVQRRLVVGGKDVTDKDIDENLKALGGKLDPKALEAARVRLAGEVAAKDLHAYADWTAAATGKGQDVGSASISRGTIVFTNVSKAYRARAEQAMDLIAVNPSITRFIAGRPCFITLVKDSNPASVIDLGKQVNVTIAYWYFDTHELGYIMGMLAHEFAIHPMADKDERVEAEEEMIGDSELETGVKTKSVLGFGGGKPHTVSTARSKQPDHIYGSLPGTRRNAIYQQTVMEMAEALAAEAAKKKVAPIEVTHLIDCFLMDCASTLGTDDNRAKGPFNTGLIADLYNRHLGFIAAATKDKSVLALLPPEKTASAVMGQYTTTAGRLVSGSASAESIDRNTYQPTEAQNAALAQRGLRLHWVEPDGRCVFGAIGHVVGQSASEVIAGLLVLLEARKPWLLQVIEDAGHTVEEVVDAIRGGRWHSDVGDIMMELAAVSLGTGVTILQANGTTVDVNGGGRVVIRVTSPLEHYHSTN